MGLPLPFNVHTKSSDLMHGVSLPQLHPYHREKAEQARVRKRGRGAPCIAKTKKRVSPYVVLQINHTLLVTERTKRPLHTSVKAQMPWPQHRPAWIISEGAEENVPILIL